MCFNGACQTQNARFTGRKIMEVQIACAVLHASLLGVACQVRLHETHILRMLSRSRIRALASLWKFDLKVQLCKLRFAGVGVRTCL